PPNNGKPPPSAHARLASIRSRLARPHFFRACARRSRLSGDRWLMFARPLTPTRRSPSSRADAGAVEHFGGAVADVARHRGRLEAHLGSGRDQDGRPDQEPAAALAPARDVDHAAHGLAHEHVALLELNKSNRGSPWTAISRFNRRSRVLMVG